METGAMPERADALPFNEPYFGALALRRLKEVQELERRRKRSPSSTAVHRLRIWPQEIALYGGEFSAGATGKMGEDTAAIAGIAGRGARSGCAARQASGSSDP